jgi:hypothetical protein
MANVLPAYEPDKVIVDVDDRPRRRTEDLTMQVMHGGVWHRRLPDMSATACGTGYHSQFAPARREALKHPLCQGCFTAFELARADAAELKDYE